MGANDPRGVGIFDPRGMVGRISNKDRYTLLHTKALGLVVSEKKIIYVFPMTSPGRRLYEPQEHG